MTFMPFCLISTIFLCKFRFVDVIIKAALLPSHISPEKIRENRLQNQDIEEQNITNDRQHNEDDSKENNLKMDLRRSIKTVEVMGLIIKNRAGSLEKSKIEEVFNEASKVHLRILTSFFEIIKNENMQQEIVTYISNRLHHINETKAEERQKEGKKVRPIAKEELEKISQKIFWNFNFSVVCGLINKIVHSIGSDKLIEITKKVCDSENAPVYFIIKHGILMWYNKNIQIDDIAKRMSESDISITADEVMRFMIINHCAMHSIGYKDRQKIEEKFNLRPNTLIHCRTQK